MGERLKRRDLLRLVGVGAASLMVPGSAAEGRQVQDGSGQGGPKTLR